MKWLPSLILFLIAVCFSMHAQKNIVIDTTTYSVEELVRDVLIKSKCAAIENVNFIGKPGQIGYFSSGSDAIQMSKGIILSTGRVHDAVGPNESTRTATNFFEVAHVGDVDLAQVANRGVNGLKDDALIEFDFIPLENSMEFEFVFASEEYCEFAGGASQYNDVFGFFLSGPGISGPYLDNAINLALSPGTSDNITVNNINQNFNYDYFIDNTPTNQPQTLANHYENCKLVTPRDGIQTLLGQDGQSVTTLEYDGYTVVLKAMSTVVPLQRYHLRIGVADVEDGSWDSAVFLKAGSFRAGQPQAVIETPDRLDCMSNAIILSGENSSSGNIYSYAWSTMDGNIVSGASGLQPSVDQPGTYQLVVSRDGNACADTAEVVVTFNDDQPEILDVTSGTLTCATPSVEIIMSIDQPARFTYQVVYPTSTASPIQNSTTFQTTHPGWHRLFVFSLSGCVDEIMHFVDIDTFSGQVVFDSYTISCSNPQLSIEPDFTDLGFPFTFQWSTSQGNILTSPDSLNIVVDRSGEYIFSANNTFNGCTGIINLTVNSDEQFPDIDAGADLQLNCIDDFVVPQATISSPAGGVLIDWISLDGGNITNGRNTLTPEIEIAGRYVLHVENENGCITTDTLLIAPPNDAPILNELHVDTLTCDVTSGIINIMIIGAYRTVNWSTTDGVIETVSANNQSALVSGAGQYLIEVTNDAGCSSQLYVDVSQTPLPMADAGLDRMLACDGNVILEAGSAIISPAVTYAWSGGPEPTFLDENVSSVVSAPGTYVLTVIDKTTGCENTDEVVISPSQNNVRHQLEFSDCQFSEGLFFINRNDVSNVSMLFYGTDQYDADAQIVVGALDEITIVKLDGCDQIVSLEYILNKPLALSFSEVGEVVAGEPFTLMVELNRGNEEILSTTWTSEIKLECTDCLAQTLTLTRPTTFIVQIEDIYGCVEEISIFIEPRIITQVYVPNAFSPNDDGINDKLEIFYNEFIASVVSMRIYDRWGNRIFSLSNDLTSSLSSDDFFWNGSTENGTKEADAGVYVFAAELKTTSDEIIMVSGSFVLVR